MGKTKTTPFDVAEHLISGDRGPDFQSILKVVRALGLKLTADAVGR